MTARNVQTATPFPLARDILKHVTPDREGQDEFGPFDVVLRNYRCFRREAPLVLSLQPGLTAFVGKNNAGKTAILRAFYELRELWRRASDPRSLLSFFKEPFVQAKIAGVDHFMDIATLAGAGPLSVELRLRDQHPGQVGCSGVTFNLSEEIPDHWSAQFEWSDGRQRDLKQIEFTANRAHFEGNELNLNSLMTACTTLKTALYIPPFRNAINHGALSHFDIPAGTAFVGQWATWKTGPDREHRQGIIGVERDIRELLELDDFQANAATDGTNLEVVVNGSSLRMREVGAGLMHFLIAFGAAATAKPSFVLIDEPEQSLHPSLQRDFVLRLARYARLGLIFTTHSLGLARSTADRVYSVIRSGQGSATKRFEDTPQFAEFLGEMSFSAYRELGFERLLLVEGTTEVKTVHQWLRRYKKEHQVVVLPLGGSSLIRKECALELSELTRLRVQVAVLIDSERSSLGASLSAERAEFVETCIGLGFAVKVTDRRATENYLTDAAIKMVKGEKYSALGNFETLKSARFGWAKHENWQIASHMSKADLESTDLHAFFGSL